MKETTTKINEMNEQAIQDHVKKFNNAVNLEKKAKLNLFLVFLNAYNSLTAKEFVKFKERIDYKKNTITKLEKICKKEIITKSLDLLPESWGTLYELARMEDDKIKNLIKKNSLNKKTTKDQVIELLTQSKTINPKVINQSSNLSIEHVIKIKKELSSASQVEKSELKLAIDKLSEFILFPKEIIEQLIQLKEVA